ncbi:TRIO-like protein [Mya arenaria]|uniref:TRIO-like protein n=1 Tax=Mya arenaria TaxID=6604 RepID=A0ABY7EQF0_MYAAR|nr:TRIO-like protein [Mya arenaria]
MYVWSVSEEHFVRVPALFKLYMLVDSIVGIQAGSQEFLFEMSPSAVTPLSSLTVKVGESAVFTCRICGRPRPYRHMDV